MDDRTRPGSRGKRETKRLDELQRARELFKDVDFNMGRWDPQDSSQGRDGSVTRNFVQTKDVEIGGHHFTLAGAWRYVKEKDGSGTNDMTFSLCDSGSAPWVLVMSIYHVENPGGEDSVETGIHRVEGASLYSGTPRVLPKGAGMAFYEKGLDFVAGAAEQRPIRHVVKARPTGMTLDEWESKVVPVLLERGYVELSRGRWEKVYPPLFGPPSGERRL